MDKVTIKQLKDIGHTVIVTHYRRFKFYNTIFTNRGEQFFFAPYSRNNHEHLHTAIKVNPTTCLDSCGGYTYIKIVHKDTKEMREFYAFCSDDESYSYKVGIQTALKHIDIKSY